MTATDLATVIVAIVALGVTATAVVLIMTLRRATDEVRSLAAALRHDVDAMMADLDDRAGAIENEMARVDGLVESAERVSARADTLSKMTYGAVARPVIRTAAVVKGTSRAARRLRGPRDLDEQAG